MLHDVPLGAGRPDFRQESANLRKSWGFTDDDFLDVYLRSGRNRWDQHPCRILIRRCLEEYLSTAGGPASVLEVGCGSGNEYDGFHSTKLADRLVYTGFDICAHNIEHARRRYPTVDFRVGDILDNVFPDRSYDVVIAKDVLEHLSLTACRFCLQECLRIARRMAVFAFFNEHPEASEHLIVPVRHYHRNQYSRRRLREYLEQFPFEVHICDLHPDQRLVYPLRSVWKLLRTSDKGRYDHA